MQVAPDADLAAVDVTLMRSSLPTIRGHVLRAAGSLATAGTVNLAARRGADVSTRGVAIDDQGRFTLSSIAPGSYDLVAFVPGEPLSLARQALVVADRDMADVTLIARSGGRTSGRVRCEGGECPRGGITVTAVADEPHAVMSTGVTDAKGEFELLFAPGSRVLRLSALPSGWWLKAVSASGRDITNELVDLTDGLDDVDMVVSQRMATISGAIDVAEGELPGDAAVLVFGAESSTWIGASTMLRRVWPSEDGHFTVPGLPPGSYKILAVDRTPRGFLEGQAAVLAAVAGRATTVSVTDRDTLDLRVRLDARRD